MALAVAKERRPDARRIIAMTWLRSVVARVRIFFWPLVLFVCGVGVAYQGAVLEHRADEEWRREAVRSELEPIRGALSRELFGAIQLTEGIAGLIAVEGEIPDEKLRAFSAELLRRNDLVRNVAVAPNNVVRFVFPLRGNERAIGFNYATSPEQWPSVARMMQEQRVVVAGPVKLVQGGIGVIGRRPVYLSDELRASAPRAYWGLISTVVDFERLLTKAAIRTVDDEMVIALRGRDGRGEKGEVFWGDARVLAQSPVTVDVPLPSGSWQLAAIPRGGWPSFRALASTYFIAGSLLSAILASALFGLLQTSAARKRVAEALAESERQLKAAMRAGRVGFWRWDRETDCVTLSDEIYDLYGIGRESALTLDDLLARFVPPEEAKAVEAALEQAKQDHRRFSIDHRIIRSDGEVQWFNTQAEFAYDEHGSATTMLGTFIDITERKRTEEALREREQRLSRVFDTVGDIIFELAVEPGERYRFVSVNPAFARETGVPYEAMIGKCVEEVLPPPSVALGLQKYREAIEQRRLVQWEETVDFPTGRRTGEITIAPVFDENGRCVQLVGSVHDVTERKLASEKIRQLNQDLQRHAAQLERRIAERTAELASAKERAESADRLKSAFLATMSHELRTPLNSIIGFTGIVLQEMPGPLNAEQKKQLGMVRNSAQHLLALINDVLDISKIEAGQLRMAAEPFDLAASIRKVANVVQPLAAKKGLALTVQATDEVDAMVGDARRVEQILLNLLSNAIKFTDAGSVALVVDRIAACSDAEKSTPCPAVRLRVADTGIGIKPEDMAQLFQPFRQIDSVLTRAYEGTGLGLAISQRLATLMGGSIQATSRWRQGSEFVVILPLRPVDKGVAA